MSNENPIPQSPPPPSPVTRKPPGIALRIFMAICGVIVMIGGIAQCNRGVREMKGGDSKEHTQLLTDSDKEIENGNKYAADGQASFQAMIADVDKNGLDDVRAKEKAVGDKASELFGKSSQAFHNAAQKLEEANKIGKDEKVKSFVSLRIKSYGLYAQGPEANQEIIRMLFDPSIPAMATLMPKITEVANRRDETQKEAVKTAEEAAAFAKASK